LPDSRGRFGGADSLQPSFRSQSGPIGFRIALDHPEMIDAIIIQNAVAHEVGLSPLWSVRRAFWQDRAAHEANLRANFLSREATRGRR
jgi:pimeloyl-ACP methyl ester carboxylesterase